MIKNYWKVFWRTAMREKFYVMSVLLGLTVAFTTCLLIWLYVFDEHTFDSSHEYADRIVRIAFLHTIAEKPFSDYYSPTETTSLFSEIPEIEKVVRVHKTDPAVRHRENIFLETEAIFATENFFEVFNYRFLEGNPASALNEKYSIVLPLNRARRYFGDEPALGKTLILNKEGVFQEQPFIVTGVIEDFPKNSSFNYDIILSHQSMKGHYLGDLSEVWAGTFALLSEGVELDQVLSKLPDLNEKYFDNTDDATTSSHLGYHLQRITDVHLDPPLDREWIPGGGGGSLQYLLILMSIGGGLLLIACINYVNLTTARAIGKTREIGVRKAVGAVRNQLISQYLPESILTCALAMGLALLLTLIGIPILNQLSSRTIPFYYLVQWPVLIGVPLAILIIGGLAGLYPAYHITRFNSTEALAGVHSGNGRGSLRNVLVITQFALSIALIVFSMHVYRQMNYIQTKDLGFDKSSLVAIDRAEQLGDQKDAFLQEIKSNSHIIEGGLARTFPGRSWGIWKDIFHERPGNVPPGYEQPTTEDYYDMNVYLADDGFLPTMGVELTEGRNLLSGQGQDTSAVLVNESAVKTFGWKNPIGKRIYRREHRQYSDENDMPQSYDYIKEFEIVGVVKDFNYFSLQNKIEPLIMLKRIDAGVLHCLFVRYARDSREETLATLESTWKKFIPQAPFVYYFVDQEMNMMYKNHASFGTLVGFFTLLSFIIAGLGILGLASFTAEKRAKEIGIRKTLGASIRDIIVLLSKDTIRWIGIACIIGLPIGFFVTNNWLENFSYRTNISAILIFIAILGALATACLSIASQIIKAAFVDPVHALRQE